MTNSSQSRNSGKIRPKDLMRQDPKGLDDSIWDEVLIYGGSTLLVILATLAIYIFLVPPPPPKSVKMAVGPKNGAYMKFAKSYKAFMAKQGFTLELIETKGSQENLELLRSNKAQVAFLQGGVVNDVEAVSQDVWSMGSFFYEPLWVFYRHDSQLETITQLRTKRIAIGVNGSGTHAVTLKLLAANGIQFDPKLHLELDSEQATEALKQGKVDAVIMVTSLQSDRIKVLLTDPGIRLMNFRRAAAYKAHLHYLASIELPEGVVDLARNVPRRTTTMIAAPANIVARRDLHEAVSYYMLTVASQFHNVGSIIEKKGEFPSSAYCELPLEPAAKRFVENGPSLLHRLLPFWVAIWLDRLKIMLLPIITLLIPLGKIAPPMYRWRVRSKIYKWYRVLREIDQDLIDENLIVDPESYLTRLRLLEYELDKVSVPLSYMEEFYNLHLHINLIRTRLRTLPQSQAPQAPEPTVESPTEE